MAKQPEKIFWSEAEKTTLVMRAIELRMERMWESPLHIVRASMAALPPDRRRKVRSLAEVPWFIELHDAELSKRLVHHKGIGAEILSTLADGWNRQQAAWEIQHEAWKVQHAALNEAVKELKAQTAALQEIVDLLRSRPL
jgi:hypothetical protein